MATTLTLKNIPPELYASLKASAELNRRSLNSEAIYRLQTGLRPERTSTTQLLEQIDAVRRSLGELRVSPRDIDRWKREGRR